MIFFKKRFLFILCALCVPWSYAELPEQSRELQYVWVVDGYQIGIDNDPPWQWRYEGLAKQGQLWLVSPDNYYPPTAVNIRLHDVFTDRGEHYFKKMASSAISTIAMNYGSKTLFELDDLEAMNFGELEGFSAVISAELEAEEQDTLVFVARNNIDQVLTLTASTLPGKIPHLSHLLKRMWGNISFIEGKHYQEK